MLFKKKENTNNNEIAEQQQKVFDAIMKMLELVKVNIVEHDAKIESLHSKYRGIETKYGKLLKMITEEQEEEDLNSSEDSNYYGNPFSR